MIPDFAVLAVIASACTVLIPVLAVFAATSVFAETKTSVYPTFEVFAVIASDCRVVIPLEALIA